MIRSLLLVYDHVAGLANAGSVAGTYVSGQILDDIAGLDPSLLGGGGTPWKPVIYRRLVARRAYTDTVGSSPMSTTAYSLPDSATGTTACASFGNRYCQAAVLTRVTWTYRPPA